MPRHIVSGLKYLATVELRRNGKIQKEIADTLQMDRSTVSHYLNGRNISWNSIEVAEVITKSCSKDFLRLTHALTKDDDQTRILLKTLLNRKYEISIKDSCIGCGLCVDNCLMNAIVLKNLKAQTDSNFCCGCLICEEGCPTGSIKIREV
jgi:4Fe-4S ferredoxin